MVQSRYVWIGVRETDILYTDTLFCGSITMFGSGTNGNLAWDRLCKKRIDHNQDIPEFTDFVQEAMQQWLRKDANVQFVYYAPLDVQPLPQHLQEYGTAWNPHSLSQFLEDKWAVRTWLSEEISVLPAAMLPAEMCTAELLAHQFPGVRAWVAQGKESCGGANTIYIDGNGTKGNLQGEQIYAVTAYQEHSVPINFHAVIYQETVLLFPPSVQLIDRHHGMMHYQGADFSAYAQLEPEQRQKAKTMAEQIGHRLRSKGYRGVCGIDLLLTPEQCYFMEINPRFQASTVLLNRGLHRLGFPSIQQYHLEAFLKAVPSNDVPEFVTGSFYIYEYDQGKRELLQWYHGWFSTRETVQVWDDGLCWSQRLEQGAYLFKMVADDAISCITLQNTVRLHPNVNLPELPGDITTYDGLLRLKLLLLCRGIAIAPSVWQQIARTGGADWEEFEAITMQIRSTIWITAPCGNFWDQLSPLSLDWDAQRETYILALIGKPLCAVTLQREDPLAARETKQGHRYGEIAYLNPDRLRMFAYSGCAMRKNGKGCRFCDLYGPEQPFTESEIYEVLDCYLQTGGFRHIMIGGGSHLPAEDVASVIQMARHIQSVQPQTLYYMGLPIPQKQVLQALKDAGIDEVAFNIEVFDRTLAKKLMPAKGSIPMDTYQKAWKESVVLWGRNGAVRSALLLGFEEMESFCQGIRMLCSLGVSPMLSVFRPANGTPLEGYMPPNESEVLRYYRQANAICSEYDMMLGPLCPVCQNNTVCLTMPESV